MEKIWGQSLPFFFRFVWLFRLGREKGNKERETKQFEIHVIRANISLNPHLDLTKYEHLLIGPPAKKEIFHYIDHPSNPWFRDCNFDFRAFDTLFPSPDYHIIKWDNVDAIVQIYCPNSIYVSYNEGQWVPILAITALQLRIMEDDLPIFVVIGGESYVYPLNQDPFGWVYSKREEIRRAKNIEIISNEDGNFEGLRPYLIYPVTSEYADFHYFYRELERWRIAFEEEGLKRGRRYEV